MFWVNDFSFYNFAKNNNVSYTKFNITINKVAGN